VCEMSSLKVGTEQACYTVSEGFKKRTRGKLVISDHKTIVIHDSKLGDYRIGLDIQFFTIKLVEPLPEEEADTFRDFMSGSKAKYVGPLGSRGLATHIIIAYTHPDGIFSSKYKWNGKPTLIRMAVGQSKVGRQYMSSSSLK
jgi:hypothetical protein